MESASKFMVDHGNPRGEDISAPELIQAVKDIINWEKTEIPGYISQGGFMAPEIYQSLSIILSLQNGGIFLQENFITLSFNEVQEAIELCSVSIYWKLAYVPFAKSPDNEYLMVDTGNGEVVQWNLDIGVVEQICKSLENYFETFRNNLLSRKLQFLGEECGFVEAV